MSNEEFSGKLSMKLEDLPWEKILLYISKVSSQSSAQNSSKSNKIASLA